MYCCRNEVARTKENNRNSTVFVALDKKKCDRDDEDVDNDNSEHDDDNDDDMMMMTTLKTMTPAMMKTRMTSRMMVATTRCQYLSALDSCIRHKTDSVVRALVQTHSILTLQTAAVRVG
jgi:hypothetical protein